MVAVRDIGAVAAAILLDLGLVPGGSIEIAGDERTGSQIATAFGAHAGRPARYETLPLEVRGGDDVMTAMFRLVRPAAGVPSRPGPDEGACPRCPRPAGLARPDRLAARRLNRRLDYRLNYA